MQSLCHEQSGNRETTILYLSLDKIPMQYQHKAYMEQCLKLAMIAKAGGKTAVGSIIVQNGEIIGEGIEGDSRLPGVVSHAEALAIIAAMEHSGSKKLSDCILYTTVEPCFMCSYLIRQTEIGMVVYGTTTEEVGGDSSGFPILKVTNKKWQTAPSIVDGILREKCVALLEKEESDYKK